MTVAYVQLTVACILMTVSLVPIIHTHHLKKRGLLHGRGSSKESWYMEAARSPSYHVYATEPHGGPPQPSHSPSRAGTTARWSDASESNTLAYPSSEVPPYSRSLGTVSYVVDSKH
jgi:hypothetical protein